jgi:hypothetical protein
MRVRHDTDETDAISSKGGKILQDNWHPRKDKAKILKYGSARTGAAIKGGKGNRKVEELANKTTSSGGVKPTTASESSHKQ